MNVNDPATDAPNLTAAQDNLAKSDGTNQSDTIRANAKPKPDLSGKWYVKLNGTINTTARYYPCSSEDGKDRIQGYGNFEAGSPTIPNNWCGIAV